METSVWMTVLVAISVVEQAGGKPLAARFVRYLGGRYANESRCRIIVHDTTLSGGAWFIGIEPEVARQDEYFGQTGHFRCTEEEGRALTMAMANYEDWLEATEYEAHLERCAEAGTDITGQY